MPERTASPGSASSGNAVARKGSTWQLVQAVGDRLRDDPGALHGDGYVVRLRAPAPEMGDHETDLDHQQDRQQDPGAAVEPGGVEVIGTGRDVCCSREHADAAGR